MSKKKIQIWSFYTSKEAPGITDDLVKIRLQNIEKCWSYVNKKRSKKGKLSKSGIFLVFWSWVQYFKYFAKRIFTGSSVIPGASFDV